MAEAGQIENISCEARNASIRRDVKAACQQKLISIPDLSADFVLREGAEDIKSVFGDDSVLLPNADVKPPKRLKGGGGLCRAFVSHLAKQPEFKLPSGRIDFASIMKQFAIEKIKGHPVILASLQEAGRVATMAHRGKYAGAGVHSDVSSFGVAHERRDKRLLREAEAAVLTSSIKDSQREEQLPASRPMSTALVPFGSITSPTDIVLAGAEKDLPEQLRVLRKWCRLSQIAAEEKKVEDLQASKAGLAKTLVVAGTDITQRMNAAKGGCVKTALGPS